jgi:hypothetical protein
MVRQVECVVKFWEVEARQDLLSDRESDEAYLAADPGRKYILYFTNGGSVILDLSDAPRDMILKWIRVDRSEWDHELPWKGGGRSKISAPGRGGWIAVLLPASCRRIPDSSIMPGTKIWDVTDPASWGGDPSIAATPDNPSDDDAPGINVAMEAAMDFLRMKQDLNEMHALQQLVYLPPGTYHLSSSVIVPKYRNTKAYIWMFGEGEDKTILQLKSAAEIGELGSQDDPVPVVQFAPYTYGREGSGNINFQLWATDFSISIPSDQPHVIGMSYGSANMGGVRRIKIQAGGSINRRPGPGNSTWRPPLNPIPWNTKGKNTPVTPPCPRS